MARHWFHFVFRKTASQWANISHLVKPGAVGARAALRLSIRRCHFPEAPRSQGKRNSMARNSASCNVMERFSSLKSLPLFDDVVEPYREIVS